MRNNFKISTVAVLAAMLVAAPAFAATITVGGNNGLLGGNGGLLGGGNGSTANATVNTGGGNNAVVDLNLNDPNANTATVDLGNTLGNGGTNAVVDLGGAGTNGGLLNLFGDNTDPTTATVNLGGGNGGDGNTLLDLFGNGGDGTTATVALGGIDTGGTGTGATGSNGPLLDLFGNDGTGANGGTGGTGGTGGDILGSGGNGGTSVRVAAVTNLGGQCFTPNAAQMDKLANRHIYGDATFRSWAGVNNLKVVDVGLCNGAGTTLAGDANVNRLQAFVAGNAVLKSSLGRAGHAPGDVIAVDKSGQTLTVYVM